MNTTTLKQIGAYQISKPLFKSNTAEYAIGISDTQQEVLLKWVPVQQVSPQGLDRWGQEMRLLKGISCAHTLLPIDMGIEDQKLFIVFEHRKIEKLWANLDFNRFSLREVLNLFIQLSSALSEVHRAGLLYQGLTPGAIALDEQLRQVTLLDFDLSQVSIESVHKTPASVLEFQLPYISPEQTGILPTQVDLRSDLYMLGCVFFEALLKKPVFDIQDPRAWLHAHVSQEVVFTAQDESAVPTPLLQILQKLLEKDPHQRYQSAQGLKSDLEAVLQLVQNQTQSIDFVPGQADIIPELELDLYLMGQQTLPQIFGATALEQTPNFWILEGKRGSGKSRLAQQFVKSEHQGIVLLGQFSATYQNVPYHAWKEIFEQLAAWLLQENQTTLSSWHKELLDASPASARVLGEWIPAFFHAFPADNSSLPVLPLREARVRFFIVLTKILELVAHKHPLMLILDDVHLADSDSLDFLGYLSTGNKLPPLTLCMLIETGQASNRLTMMKQHCLTPISKVYQRSLNDEEVLQWLSKTLGPAQWGLADLAQALNAKVEGNPRALVQAMLLHQQRKDLHFNFGSGSWEWNLDQIRKNLPLPSQNIDWSTLSEQTQNAGKKIALLQLNYFSEEDLVFLLEGVENPQALIQAGRQQGLIEIGQVESPKKQKIYRIVPNEFWDRIRQELPHEEAITIHREIVNWYSNRPDKDTLENLASVSDHFEAIGSQNWCSVEKKQAFSLNSTCGHLALQSFAYNTADVYYTRALNYLPENAWRENYAQTLNLWQTAAQVKLYKGAYVEVLDLITQVFNHAKAPQDKAVGVELQMEAWKQRNEPDQAIDFGLQYLRELGLELSPNPSEMQSNILFMKVLVPFSMQKESRIIARNKVQNPIVLARAKVLIALGPLVYLSRPALISPIMREELLLVFNHGHLDHSAYWFASLAMVMKGHLNNDKLSQKAANIAEKLLSSPEYFHTKAKTLFTLNFFVYHWKKPLLQTVATARQNLDLAFSTSDYEFAAYSMLLICSHALDAGIYLEQIQAELEEFIARTASIFQIPLLNLLKIYRQYFKALTKPDLEDAFEPIEEQPEWYRDRTATALRYLLELEVLFFFGNYAQAKEVAELRAPLQDTGRSTVYFAKFVLFQALSILAGGNKKTAPISKKEHTTVRKALKALSKWNKKMPDNFEAKNALLNAEWLRYNLDLAEAQKYYTLSIKSSAVAGCSWLQALAWERMGQMYEEQENWPQAQLYLRQAQSIWKDWGALAKVQQLEAFFANQPQMRLALNNYSSENELTTVLQTAATIVGALRYEDLLEKLMRLLIEEFGAQEGMIARIVNGNAHTDLEAYYQGSQLICQRPESSSRILKFIPEFVLQKLIESKEQFIIRNNVDYELIRSVESGKLPAALFAYPIVNRNEVIGVLFLLHHQLNGVFQEKHLQLMKLLAGQLGVSFQNALLYQEMEMEVQKRTETISQINQEIVLKNQRLEQQIELEKQLKRQQEELIELKLQAQAQELDVSIANAEILGQTLERKKIAVDLHDNVKSSLTAVSIQLTVLDNTNLLADSREPLQKARRSLKEAHAELHRIMHNLSPMVLHDEGLEGAIRELCDGVSTEDLPVRFSSNLEGARFDTKLELTLYPVCKELLSNALRHANAKQIEVSLQQNLLDALVYLQVKDDGIGFSPEKKVRKNAIGMASIHSRIRYISGVVDVTSAPGKGTDIRIKAPLE